MTTGIPIPSYAAQATWTAVRMVGDYPAQNMADLVTPSKVGRGNAAGTDFLTFTLPVAVPMRFVALVNHNIPAGVLMRVALWSDTSNGAFGGSPGTSVYDSGLVDTWPTGGPIQGWPSVRPILLPGEVMVRSGRFQISGFSDPIEIGAIELAGFWEWTGVSYGRGMNVDSRSSPLSLIGGGRRPGAGGRTRKVDGAIDKLALAVAQTQALDFQKITDLNQPFVWTEDLDDPTSWPRKSFLARNIAVPALVGAVYRSDKFVFQFTEHRR